jgi:hypothetical protein
VGLWDKHHMEGKCATIDLWIVMIYTTWACKYMYLIQVLETESDKAGVAWTVVQVRREEAGITSHSPAVRALRVAPALAAVTSLLLPSLNTFFSSVLSLSLPPPNA